MKTNELKNGGYNLSVLAQSKWKRRRKVAVRIFVLLVFLSICGYFAADYFSRLPRERFARDYSYWQRVKLGASHVFSVAYLSLTSPPEDPGSSPLPIAEIFIEGQRLDKLNSNLPMSGGEYTPADVRFGNDTYQADVRFRGDSINHWAYPSKSWRVRLDGADFHDGMKYINLTVPRSETQLSNWLGYQMAEKIGIPLVPEASFVHFRLNRRFDGVRIMLEQPNQDFLMRRQLPAGKIYVGDITSEQIYGSLPRKRIYYDASGWEVHPPVEDIAPTNGEMRRLVRLIREQHDPYKFFYAVRNLVDTESLLKYMALLEIVGSVHVDDTHNGKFYFNSATGLFEPIVWDTVAYYWKNTKRIDLGSNGLFRKMLGIPEYREQKDRLMWEAIHGPLDAGGLQSLVDDAAKRLRVDLYSWPLKLSAGDKGVHHLSNAQWEDAVQELKEVIRERHQALTRQLQEAKATYRLQEVEGTTGKRNYLLGIQVESRSGILLDRLRLQLKTREQTAVTIARRGVEDIRYPLNDKVEKTEIARDGAVEFALNDHLFSKRKFQRGGAKLVPGLYVYRITLPERASLSDEVEFDARNGVTDSVQVQLVRENDLNIPEKHARNSIWWKPDAFAGRKQLFWQGQMSFEKDVVLDQYTDLTIRPGAEIVFGPEASLVVSGGSLQAEGTSSQPIVFRGKARFRPWGVVALRHGAKGTFRHVEFRGGGKDYVDHVLYEGSLSIHAAEAAVRDSRFEDSTARVRFGTLRLDGVTFRNIFPRPLFAESATIHQKDVVHERLPEVTKVRPKDVPFVGTPARREREFKFSLAGAALAGYDLESTAELIRQALAASIERNDAWAVPPLVKSEYWPDAEVADFMFRDLYFDTPDSLNYKHAVSYRLRNRYRSFNAYRRHTKRPHWPREWPYRLEFQGKVDRQEEGGGFSSVAESRLEFRKESPPFSVTSPPPPPPWELDIFVPYFRAGHYQGMPALPAQHVVEFLNEREGREREEFVFDPELFILTERIRKHLNIRTPWGSGPNPEQAFIISLDRSYVYEASEYLRFLQARALGVKRQPEPLPAGQFTEIELEFERNVSDLLDQEISEAQAVDDEETLSRLVKVRRAFLNDQRMILKVITRHLAELGIKVQPVVKSKYVQAYEMLHHSSAGRERAQAVSPDEHSEYEQER